LGEEKGRESALCTDSDWPGGALVKYLQATGLGAGPYTTREEALGQSGHGGDDDVTVYFFGFQ